MKKVSLIQLLALTLILGSFTYFNTLELRNSNVDHCESENEQIRMPLYESVVKEQGEDSPQVHRLIASVSDYAKFPGSPEINCEELFKKPWPL
jgi:hypothetical protein